MGGGVGGHSRGESEGTSGRWPQPGREVEAASAAWGTASAVSFQTPSPTQGARIDKPCGSIPISQSLGWKSV